MPEVVQWLIGMVLMFAFVAALSFVVQVVLVVLAHFTKYLDKKRDARKARSRREYIQQISSPLEASHLLNTNTNRTLLNIHLLAFVGVKPSQDGSTAIICDSSDPDSEPWFMFNISPVLYYDSLGSDIEVDYLILFNIKQWVPVIIIRDTTIDNMYYAREAKDIYGLEVRFNKSFPGSLTRFVNNLDFKEMRRLARKWTR